MTKTLHLKITKQFRKKTKMKINEKKNRKKAIEKITKAIKWIQTKMNEHI